MPCLLPSPLWKCWCLKKRRWFGKMRCLSSARKFTFIFEVLFYLLELRTASCGLFIQHWMLKEIQHAFTLPREQHDCTCLKPRTLLLPVFKDAMDLSLTKGPCLGESASLFKDHWARSPTAEGEGGGLLETKKDVTFHPSWECRVHIKSVQCPLA